MSTLLSFYSAPLAHIRSKSLTDIIEFFGEVSHFTERSGFLELFVIFEKLMVYRVVSNDIGERRSAQDEENGRQ